MGERFYGFAYCFYNNLRRPAALIRLAHGASQLPPGEALVPCRRAPFESGGDIPGTFPERHTGRSLRFRWWVDSFIHTGYHCNVAGGRLPMELWCDCPRQSIDFNSLREAPPLHAHPLRYRLMIRRNTRNVRPPKNCPLSIGKKLSTVHCQLLQRSVREREGPFPLADGTLERRFSGGKPTHYFLCALWLSIYRPGGAYAV